MAASFYLSSESVWMEAKLTLVVTFFYYNMSPGQKPSAQLFLDVKSLLFGYNENAKRCEQPLIQIDEVNNTVSSTYFCRRHLVHENLQVRPGRKPAPELAAPGTAGTRNPGLPA
jgi:hypothetical protein